MSVRWETRFTCSCGAELVADAFLTLNASADPQLRQQVLDRSLNTFRCAQCGLGLTLVQPMGYLDLERHQLLGVFAGDDLPNADECARFYLEVYRAVILEGPPPLASRAERFLARVCFGLEELREKLVLDEAGLSDLPLEVLKGDLMAHLPALERQRVRALALDRLTRGGDLLFCLVEASGALSGQTITARRSLYDTYARMGEALLEIRPGIARGPHVSVLRLGL